MIDDYSKSFSELRKDSDTNKTDCHILDPDKHEKKLK